MNDATLEAFFKTAKRPGMALVLSADQLSLVRKLSRNKDLAQLVKLARRSGVKFLVAGGELHKKDSGCIGLLVNEPGLLLTAVGMLHARLAEARADQSFWLVQVGDRTAEVQSYLATIADTEGAKH